SPPSPGTILALGGEIKPSLCLLSRSKAWLLHPDYRLSDPDDFRAFLREAEDLKKKAGQEPEWVACDMHPEYTTTRYARSLGTSFIEVQHHHAHIAACMAENSLDKPVVGICCDGTGYGMDGAIWGCEILLCDRAGFTRMGHLDYFPLPGGDAGARDPWRPAAGLLYQALGSDGLRSAKAVLDRIDRAGLDLLAQRLAGGAPLPQTSSLGRLFDAAAFLLGLCDKNRFDAEAPIALENAARESKGSVKPYPFLIAGNPQPDSDGNVEPLRFDPRPMMESMIRDLQSNRSIPDMAMSFHLTVAEALAAMALAVSEKTGIADLVLSGGCFANRILTIQLLHRLQSRKERIWQHRITSPGDQSLALGQVAVASMQIVKERV
ncbi:MAG: carbamoyltransferase HypF, partial [Planctomycetota bacterium]